MSTGPDAGCKAVARRLDDYLADRLGEDERAGVRAHLSQCRSCREEAARKDPSLVFLALADRRKNEFFWASLWRDLQDHLSERKRPLLGGRRGWSAAAAVLAVMLVGYLTLWGPDPLRNPTQAGRPSPVRAEPARPPQKSAALPAAVPEPLFTVDDPEVRVVLIESKTPIVMFYDPRIDL